MTEFKISTINRLDYIQNKAFFLNGKKDIDKLN